MQPCDRLTPKEIQVATLVWEGQTNREIADVIGTTEQVIKNYLRNTFDKLGVWSRLELALYVAAHGGARWHRPSDRLPGTTVSTQIPCLVATSGNASSDPNDQESARSSHKAKVLPKLISA